MPIIKYMPDTMLHSYLLKGGKIQMLMLSLAHLIQMQKITVKREILKAMYNANMTELKIFIKLNKMAEGV